MIQRTRTRFDRLEPARGLPCQCGRDGQARGFGSRREAVLTVTFLALAIPGAVIDAAFLVERMLYGPAIANLHPLLGEVIDAAWRPVADAPGWVQGATVLLAFAVMLAGVPGALAIVLAIPAGLLWLSFRLTKGDPNRANRRQDAAVILFLVLIATLAFGTLYIQP